MAKTLIGYARCSTDKQDLSAQQRALIELGVAPDRIYTDRGLTGTKTRPAQQRDGAPGKRSATFVMVTGPVDDELPITNVLEPCHWPGN